MTNKYQTLVEVYKTSKIFKHTTSGKFCAFHADGGWYGWCDYIDTVKQQIDARALGF